MNEPRTFSAFFQRVLLPIVIAAVLVIATVAVSGSVLMRIEDVYVSRILAGAYGTPDWRVQEMNPLAAQILTLLYRIVPSVNWYGAALLLLLLLAVAALLSLAARKRGGLAPVTLILGPVTVLLTNAMHSTAVCAICAAAGALLLMDGAGRKKRDGGLAFAIAGGLLFALAAALSLTWAVILAAGAALCWLPSVIRDGRLRGLALGLPVMAVIAVALYGYSALMYSTPELSAYRQDYALYERLQHSSLKEESDALTSQYGTAFFSVGHGETSGESLPLDANPKTVFDAVGWSVNDASLFFTRYGADTKLTDPEVLRVLEKEASFLSTDLGRLWRELFATLKKPQFLLLIALFATAALATLVTSRRKGFAMLLASVIAFGGHVFALMRYYDTFAEIAPFYLLALAVLLYRFDGEEARAWLCRVLAGRWLRMGVSAGVLVCFAAGMAGLWYYLRVTPIKGSDITKEAIDFIEPYIQGHPDMLFIGDNPNDRYKPDTLAAPGRGQDANLLAGSYDLYSPRAAALLAKFGIANPLVDCIGREDIAYVSMSFTEPMAIHLASAYGIYLKPAVDLAAKEYYAEKIFALEAYTDEEAAEIQRQAEADRLATEEQNALWAEFAADEEAQAQLQALFDAMEEEAQANATKPLPSIPPATEAPDGNASESGAADGT